MNMAYSASDVFVISSVEDNLPNTVIESLLSGTPVIGFNIGGVRDMIIDGENGYLVQDINEELLAAAIRKFFNGEKTFDKNKIRENAVERFGIDIQVRSYMELYNKILN
jgi:glycosyltransferase involved in cell wall biosynthesis